MKPFKYLATLLCLLIVIAKGYPQKIHWADHVIFQHNQYSEEEFSGNEMLGSPDAAPYGKLSKNAFRLNEESSYGIVSLGYKVPIQVSQIIIVENFLPNHIDKVLLKDTEGKDHLIYEPRNEAIHIPSRVLSINIEKTPYKVAALTIHLNTFEHSGWAQIDAIGISEIVHSEETLSELIEQDEFDYSEDIRFANEKEKLSANVNTEYGEAKPIISPDGRTLYFVRKFSPQNVGGKDDEQDIYYSNYINGRWTIAQNIGWPLNDKYPNGICSISPDGNTIWVLNSYDVESGIIQDGISVSHKTEDGNWSQPEQLNIDNFYNKNEFQDYSVSASGNVLLLAIETNESLGEQDIYVSFNKGDNSWTEPKNLGRSINTEFIEYSPYLSIDEKVLFFASTGHGSQQGGDIYYSQRLDDSWMNWTAPKNVGFAVNSDHLDSYFTISPNNQYAYFVSTATENPEGGLDFTGMDIYRIPINLEPEPEKIITMKGKVFDKSNNDPLYGKINLTSTEGTTYQGFTTSNIKTGEYDVKISDNSNYFISVQVDGFLNYTDTVSIENTDEIREIAYHIPMEKVTKGHKFALNNLFFVQSRADLLPGSEPELERLYNLMINNPTLKIQLGGHTDNQGFRSANIRLSKERAQTVKDFLTGKGIDDNRIKTAGYGPSQPIAPNDTEENMAKNRRVEVEILDI